MDEMEKQQKFMAFLQKNTAQATTMMQEIAMAGQKANETLERLGERTKALD